MSLKEKIETNYKSSLKAKNKMQISTYRLILSSIKDLDIANRSGPNKKETDDEDIKKLLKKMIKQRSESIEIYTKNNRQDLLEVEQNEFDLISVFIRRIVRGINPFKPDRRHIHYLMLDRGVSPSISLLALQIRDRI